MFGFLDLTGPKLGLAGLLALLTTVLGGWDFPLQLLIYAMALDFVTGTVAAARAGRLSSQVSWSGFSVKVMKLLLVAVAYQVDLAFQYKGLDTKNLIRETVIWAYWISEIISNVENIAEFAPIPRVITDALAKFKQAVGGEMESSRG